MILVLSVEVFVCILGSFSAGMDLLSLSQNSFGKGRFFLGNGHNVIFDSVLLRRVTLFISAVCCFVVCCSVRDKLLVTSASDWQSLPQSCMSELICSCKVISTEKVGDESLITIVSSDDEISSSSLNAGTSSPFSSVETIKSRYFRTGNEITNLISRLT